MPTDQIPTIGLLGRAYNVLSAEIVRRVQESGATDIRPSHGNVMEQLSFEEPLRLSQVAERSGITAQSAGALVDELEALGYERRGSDPKDRRAKLIHLTPKGRRNAQRAFDIVTDIEAELRAQLGERRLVALRKTLIELVEG
jgi:DNA-binding MarR family transcriptional regulator